MNLTTLTETELLSYEEEFDVFHDDMQKRITWTKLIDILLMVIFFAYYRHWEKTSK